MDEKNKQKRLLFIVTQSEFGGAQRFLFELLNGIRHEPYEILLATGSDGGDAFGNEARSLGLTVRVLPRLKRNPHLAHDIAAVWEIRNLIRDWQPDTVFLNSSKAGFVGALGARISGLRPRVVYRIGGWTFNDPWPAWKRTFWRWLEKFNAGWKDYIIVNNTHDLEQAKRFHIRPRTELLLVHNGIDPYKIDFIPRDTAREELLSRVSLQAGKPIRPKHIVGTIANFYPAKGLEHLIEAAALADLETIFVVIGDGQERNKLEKQIADAHLADRVFLLGQLANASRYLYGFDIFALPSVKEGFPWSVLEAMSAKLPVIATGVGAIPEIIEPGVNGYIVPLADAKALAEKIAMLTGNNLLANTMSIQAHQTVVLKFSLDHMISQIQRVL